MRKILIAVLATSLVAMPAVPAQAGKTTAAILGVVGGTALGVGVSSLVRNRNSAPVVPGYRPSAYAYQQDPVPAYDPAYGTDNTAYAPPPPRAIARPVPKPAPGGVACLKWTGYAYAPAGC